MNQSDTNRNSYMLQGALAKRGYMRWWHSFRGSNPVTRQTRTFFIEYFMINPSSGCDRPILGQHPYYRKRGIRPSYVMVKAGVFPDEEAPGKQLHAFYPITSLRVVRNPFYLQAEECVLCENRISGYVEMSEAEAEQPFFMTDAGSMEWNLEVYKSIACHTGFIAGPLSNALNLLDSFWHGEGIRTNYSGSVMLDGITYEVSSQGSFGYADKHWGRSFNRPWLQLSACKLRSERTGKLLKYSALAVDGCCPRLLCFPLRPRLTLQLTYTGEDFCFSFTRPRLRSRIKWRKKETGKRFIWHLKAQNKKAVLKLSMNCLKKNMMPLHYESPTGRRRKAPLYASGSGMGTLELYRMAPEGLQWIDTLYIENALCEFQAGE
ncbi:MAG: hypothetical protein NC081_04300 [Roseburia sp.]|nr:hypothetical protein [Roseburia sp.]